jgi:hypothetical protein
VAIEREGRQHRGSYTVERRIITVRCDDGPPKTTQLGGSSTEPLAQMLPEELVAENSSRD